MALDPHRVLQISECATMREITRAYRKKAKLFHPDLQPTEAARRAATENMTRVNAAYETLKRQHRSGKSHRPGRKKGHAPDDERSRRRRAEAREVFRRARAAAQGPPPSLDRWWELPRFIVILETVIVIASLALGLWSKWIVWTMMLLPAQISTLLLLMHLAPERRGPRKNPRGSVWQALIWVAVCTCLYLWHWTLLLLPFPIMLARYLDHVGL